MVEHNIEIPQSNILMPISAWYRVKWLDTAWFCIDDDARTATLDWTELDCSEYVSQDAQTVILLVRVAPSAINAAAYMEAKFRQKGLTAAMYPTASIVQKTGIEAGGWHDYQLICGIDQDKIFEYTMVLSGVMTFDTSVVLLGYME